MKNPDWTKDELILALDLYFRVNPSSTNSKNPEIIELSKFLNTLPIHPKELTNEEFRTPDSVYMKMSNFLSVDPNYHGKGLRQNSKLDSVVWNQFNRDSDKVHEAAELIRKHYKEVSLPQYENIEVDVDEEFEEGKIITKLHKARERNPKIVKSKKALVLKDTGKLECEICGFDFYFTYGDIGYGFAECHHTKPVSELIPGEKTKVNDLSIVCSNCHRMIHRTKPMKSISEMRNLIRE